MAKDQDDGGSWIDGEIENSGFGDFRLSDRLRKLMGTTTRRVGGIGAGALVGRSSIRRLQGAPTQILEWMRQFQIS